jgi:putative SOS response-associated peptidase YedK
VIPASGYYEWETRPDGKQPHYFTPADGQILTIATCGPIAGLWTEWRDRVNDETLTTCTMIIAEANSFISKIHDRMPVLLDCEGADAWLPGEALAALMPIAVLHGTADGQRASWRDAGVLC